MDLKDFVKELAVNLNRDNVDEYKNRAASLVMDVDTLTGEELAAMINSSTTYDHSLRTTFMGDEKKLVEGVRRMMKETEVFLRFAAEFFSHHKRSFGWMNKITKDWLANPSHLGPYLMTDKVIDHWLSNPKAQIFTETNLTNDLFDIISTYDKRIITSTISHKNFKNIASHYPLRELVTDSDYDKYLTKKTFDISFTRMMQIINSSNGWNTDFSRELAPAIRSPYIQLKHITMLSTEQEIGMYEYAVTNKVKMSQDIMKYFYEITGDDELLPDEAKDVFLF